MSKWDGSDGFCMIGRGDYLRIRRKAPTSQQAFDANMADHEQEAMVARRAVEDAFSRDGGGNSREERQ